MSTQTKAKKGFLATGIGVLTTGITVLVNGSTVEGSLLVAVGVGLILAYDYLDDKLKGAPSLPEGVDEEAIEATVGLAASQIQSLRENAEETSATNTSPSETSDKRDTDEATDESKDDN